MRFYFFIIFNLFFSISISAQEILPKFKWLRSGIVVGIASQNNLIKQEWDYTYETQIFKFSNHFNWSKKRKHSWEILVEPSYYRSNHQMINYWFISHTVPNGDALRAKYMQPKTINEYALNAGIIYRRFLNVQASVFATLNSGPMYIDTDTERLKKGFAFSDVISIGYNYKWKKISFDAKFMFRHASNANLQKPNYGLNAAGFEFGTFYEFN
ncbi:acyloxyacyl hydrolase [Flavobacterium difficile]|uniref:Acyloxyacyl hydrolase n=1 Tax=Flavobacterium difficile TaxID=2709659 RepID=A0ABX0I625_9FLAO|nr:acyloxyacyl hydrolase [Flavobacterium difficile]NHM00985.1 acyloxyacyl hydrolase [Flavobacterium difficile]